MFGKKAWRLVCARKMHFADQSGFLTVVGNTTGFKTLASLFIVCTFFILLILIHYLYHTFVIG